MEPPSSGRIARSRPWGQRTPRDNLQSDAMSQDWRSPLRLSVVNVNLQCSYLGDNLVDVIAEEGVAERGLVLFSFDREILQLFLRLADTI